MGRILGDDADDNFDTLDKDRQSDIFFRLVDFRDHILGLEEYAKFETSDREEFITVLDALQKHKCLHILWNAFPEFNDLRDVARAPDIMQDFHYDFSDWRNATRDLPARGDPQLQGLAKAYIIRAAFWARIVMEEKVRDAFPDAMAVEIAEGGNEDIPFEALMAKSALLMEEDKQLLAWHAQLMRVTDLPEEYLGELRLIKPGPRQRVTAAGLSGFGGARAGKARGGTSGGGKSGAGQGGSGKYGGRLDRHDRDRFQIDPNARPQKPNITTATGLRNAGNSCYLNSLLQFCRKSPRFISVLLGGEDFFVAFDAQYLDYPEETGLATVLLLLSRNHLPEALAAYNRFFELVDHLYDSKIDHVLVKFATMLEVQQDAVEFLLEVMSESKVFPRLAPLIEQAFVHTLYSTYECPRCYTKHKGRVEPNTVLGVQMYPRTTTNRNQSMDLVELLIWKYGMPSVCEYTCPSCDEWSEEAITTENFAPAPGGLQRDVIIQIGRRVELEPGVVVKDSRTVSFEMKPFVVPIFNRPDAKERLWYVSAVMHHAGRGGTSGHWFTDSRGGWDKPWTRYNDSSKSTVTANQIITGTAVVLCLTEWRPQEYTIPLQAVEELAAPSMAMLTKMRRDGRLAHLKGADDVPLELISTIAGEIAPIFAQLGAAVTSLTKQGHVGLSTWLGPLTWRLTLPVLEEIEPIPRAARDDPDWVSLQEDEQAERPERDETDLPPGLQRRDSSTHVAQRLLKWPYERSPAVSHDRNESFEDLLNRVVRLYFWASWEPAAPRIANEQMEVVRGLLSFRTLRSIINSIASFMTREYRGQMQADARRVEARLELFRCFRYSPSLMHAWPTREEARIVGSLSLDNDRGEDAVHDEIRRMGTQFVTQHTESRSRSLPRTMHLLAPVRGVRRHDDQPRPTWDELISDGIYMSDGPTAAPNHGMEMDTNSDEEMQSDTDSALEFPTAAGPEPRHTTPPGPAPAAGLRPTILYRPSDGARPSSHNSGSKLSTPGLLPTHPPPSDGRPTPLDLLFYEPPPPRPLNASPARPPSLGGGWHPQQLADPVLSGNERSSSMELPQPSSHDVDMTDRVSPAPIIDLADLETSEEVTEEVAKRAQTALEQGSFLKRMVGQAKKSKTAAANNLKKAKSFARLRLNRSVVDLPRSGTDRTSGDAGGLQPSVVDNTRQLPLAITGVTSSTHGRPIVWDDITADLSKATAPGKPRTYQPTGPSAVQEPPSVVQEPTARPESAPPVVHRTRYGHQGREIPPVPPIPAHHRANSAAINPPHLPSEIAETQFHPLPPRLNSPEVLETQFPTQPPRVVSPEHAETQFVPEPLHPRQRLFQQPRSRRYARTGQVENTSSTQESSDVSAGAPVMPRRLPATSKSEPAVQPRQVGDTAFQTMAERNILQHRQDEQAVQREAVLRDGDQRDRAAAQQLEAELARRPGRSRRTARPVSRIPRRSERPAPDDEDTVGQGHEQDREQDGDQQRPRGSGKRSER
ncbi:hypothetical protein LTR65_007096 [Meristemomyces frigidus]